MHRKKQNASKPWCWYCGHEFNKEIKLVQHQSAEHFTCQFCHKKLYTGPQLAFHCEQIHKQSIDKVPNSLPNRSSIQIEINGMRGIPRKDISEHEEQENGSAWIEVEEEGLATNPEASQLLATENMKPHEISSNVAQMDAVAPPGVPVLPQVMPDGPPGQLFPATTTTTDPASINTPAESYIVYAENATASTIAAAADGTGSSAAITGIMTHPSEDLSMQEKFALEAIVTHPFENLSMQETLALEAQYQEIATHQAMQQMLEQTGQEHIQLLVTAAAQQQNQENHVKALFTEAAASGIGSRVASQTDFQRCMYELYEINDDPKRKEFLDDLFLFMQKRGTPINRLPIMAKSVLDLYELYNLVIARGGLVDVINKKLWQEIIKGLHLPSSITSAAFTLRTQYMKYLYPYECEKKNLSTPAELQAAIDGNRREGRRSSYGQFESPSVQRSPIPQSIQQMSPLSLVTHANQQHHRLLGGPNVAQMPNIMSADFEQRMLDYIKLFQPNRDLKREDSPDIARDALNALEMSRVALWNMYNSNQPAATSPPSSLNQSPSEIQREALNLSDSPPHHMAIKREREHPMDYTDRSGSASGSGSAGSRDYHSGVPPTKRSSNSTNSIAAVAAAAAASQLQQAAAVAAAAQQQQHLHSRSLSPQKLSLSTAQDDEEDDDARSNTENGTHSGPNAGDEDEDVGQGAPINLRGVMENGLRHHLERGENAAGVTNEDDDDEEEEDEDEEMRLPEVNPHHHHHPHHHHPLALNRLTEQAAAALVAAQREREREQVNQLASLNLSLLERERERCDSADKLKRQHQQQLEQLQREQHQLLQQQQQVQQHHHQLFQRERELREQQQQQQQLQQQQTNGRDSHDDSRDDNGTGLEMDTNCTEEAQNLSESRHGFDTEKGSSSNTGAPIGAGIMGMQFKIISRGDASKGDQQLVVSMEFNGVQYEGVLFANPPSSRRPGSNDAKPPRGGANSGAGCSTSNMNRTNASPLLMATSSAATGTHLTVPSSSSPSAISNASSSLGNSSLISSGGSPIGSSSIVSPSKTNVSNSSTSDEQLMATPTTSSAATMSAPPVVTSRPLVS